MTEQLTFLIWESEIIRTGPGSVSVVARRPLSTMSCKQAGKVLELGRDRIYDLWQAGLLEGFKPGAVATRRDGRASNAALRLDSARGLGDRGRQLGAARKGGGGWAW